MNNKKKEAQVADVAVDSLAAECHKLDSKLPDPPLMLEDIPQSLPPITQAELTSLVDAELRFRVARADYEAKRATVTLKLLLLCLPEPGDFGAELNRDGELVLTENCACCGQTH
ncbi:MAG: hypothetical protein ABSB82_19765 [Terriglobia bacterium]|jgi:hypothetical protein